MPPLENPFPKLAEAADAATRIVSLQTDLFLLKQELRTIRQIKRIIWVAAGLILLNLLLTLTFFWIQTGLHESGWSAFSLAFMSFLFFGILTLITGTAAFRLNSEPKPRRGSNEAISAQPRGET